MLKIVSAAKNDRAIKNSTCPYFGYKKFRYLTNSYKKLLFFAAKENSFNFLFKISFLAIAF